MFRSRRKYLSLNTVNLICTIPGTQTALSMQCSSSWWAMLLTRGTLTPQQLPIFSDGGSTCRKKHSSHNTLVSPCSISPEFKFLIFLTLNINICSHLAQVHSWLCVGLGVWVRAQTQPCTCLLFISVVQVWGSTHGWLSNRRWCSARPPRPCSWIIKPRAIMAFTQINQSMLDASCNWVSGYFLQHTWAGIKCWISIMNGSCPTQGG